MKEETYLLDKACRFMNVAGTYLEEDEYKDIVAFNIHMALELAFSFVVERLLRVYKPPMYMAYKREFPVQATHNLSHVCYVLSSYVDFPVYLAFPLTQMNGWCVNSRYSESFSDSVEQRNLVIIYNAVGRFLATLGLLLSVKHVDKELGDAGLKGKITYYRNKLYVVAESEEKQEEFFKVIEANSELIEEFCRSSQEDYKFICAFMSNLEMVGFRQVFVKLMSHSKLTDEDLEKVRKCLGFMRIENYQDFMKKLGGYANKYGVSEEKFKEIMGSA